MIYESLLGNQSCINKNIISLVASVKLLIYLDVLSITELRSVMYPHFRNIYLVQVYRAFFPLDGAGLRRLFHNGRRQNDDFDWSFDDVIKFYEFLRQASLHGSHFGMGLL